MRLPSPPLVARLALPAAGLLLGLASTASAQVSAQTASGSESYVALAGGVMSGGGSATSTNYQSTSGFGQFTTGLNTGGTTNSAVGGIVGAGASSSTPFLGAPPIVFGFKDGVNKGTKDGGDLRTIIGLNFLSGLGGGAGGAEDAGTTTQVYFGSTAVPPEDTTVTSDTEIDVTTPTGVDASSANPLGRTDVRVTTTDGTGELCGAYVYQPALTDDHTTDDTPLGADLVVTLSTTVTGSSTDTDTSGGGAGGSPFFVGLSVGAVQGQITLFPQFEGSLELDAATQIPVLFTAAVPGDTVLFASLSVNDPSLVGIPFQLQAALFTLEGGLSGEFTNTLPITFSL